MRKKTTNRPLVEQRSLALTRPQLTFRECPTGLAPVVNRFNNYSRHDGDSVGRARSVTSIVATPRPKLAADRLGLVRVPI